jgi:predicted O-methyltransferase YrrM
MNDTEETNRLEELMNISRVPLPPDVPDDEHNRVGGLIEMIEDWLNPFGEVMELGTGMGVSTEVFALLISEGHIHTTDIYPPGNPWRIASEAVAKRYSNIRQYFQDCNELAKQFPDDFFQAVYIDEVHEYANVLRDIRAWQPKIMLGGIICGHDYIERPAYNFGVIRAVKEAFGEPDIVYKDTSWVVMRKNGGKW